MLSKIAGTQLGHTVSCLLGVTYCFSFGQSCSLQLLSRVPEILYGKDDQIPDKLLFVSDNMLDCWASHVCQNITVASITQLA